MDHTTIQLNFDIFLWFSSNHRRLEEQIDASHVRMPNSVRSIRHNNPNMDASSGCLAQTPDNDAIRDIRMLYDDAFFRFNDFPNDLSADNSFILDVDQYFRSLSDFFHDPSFFCRMRSDAQSQISCHIHHIIMPSSQIRIEMIRIFQILIRNIHSSDQSTTIGSTFIKNIDFRMVVFSQIFKKKHRF